MPSLLRVAIEWSIVHLDIGPGDLVVTGGRNGVVVWAGLDSADGRGGTKANVHVTFGAVCHCSGEGT